MVLPVTIKPVGMFEWLFVKLLKKVVAFKKYQLSMKSLVQKTLMAGNEVAISEASLADINDFKIKFRRNQQLHEAKKVPKMDDRFHF